MAILSKQIGWSQESNLLWEILKQLNKLAGLFKPKYKVYTALVSQSGTNDPTAIVLENTTNVPIDFERNGAGRYYINYSSTGATANQVFLIMPQMRLNGFEEQVVYYFAQVTSGIIYLDTYYELGGYQDDLLQNVPIEIRFYN